MAATRIYKLDDGNPHPTNCFPARSLLRPCYEEGAGHWEVARRAAEKVKTDGWFGSKFTRIQWRGPGMLFGPPRQLNEKTLTGVFLMKLHQVESPSHLCSVDVSNQNFTSAKEEDFEQFDSVAYINAAENLFTLEVFRKFPALRELDLSLNGLRNLKINPEDFPHLEILDLSYNNLSPEDVRALGLLPHLKALHLTANGLSSLPLDLAVPDGCLKFPALEVLLLDDNHLSHPNVFVSLANLRSLKQLNLDRNGIREVPYLHHIENSRFSIHPLSTQSGIREGLRSRRSAEIQRRQGVLSALGERADYFTGQNSMGEDRTEVFVETCSPDPSVQGDTPVHRPVSKISSTSFGQEFALPLMELRYLSLANNEMEHEEDLLAVALFPSLTELTFHGNPFTTSRSGDPPLLTSFLQDKLGIKLVRKKISKLEKPRIFIPVKANRKVKSPLPRVRKHPPMLEGPLESTFWELWTGTESDLSTRAGLNEFEPLPAINQFSAKAGTSSASVKEESGSWCTFPSQDDHFELGPGAQTSLDQLCGLPHTVSSMPDLILSASLPPHGSFVGEPSQLGFAASTPAEQEPSRSLMLIRERTQLKTETPVGASSAEPERSELVPLPGSSGQGANLSGALPPTAEEDSSQILQSFHSASEPQALSEPAPPTGSPPREQDLARSLPPIRSTSVGQNLTEASPPAESPDQWKPVDASPGQGLNLSEHVLLGRSAAPDQSQLHLPPGPPLEECDRLQIFSSIISLARGQNWSEISQVLSGMIAPPNSLVFEPGQLEELALCPLVEMPSAIQDLLEALSLSSSSFQEQVLLDSVPPTGPPARDQDLTASLPPRDEQIRLEVPPPSAEQDQVDSLPPAVLTFQEPNRSDTEQRSRPSSVQQEPPKPIPETSSPSAAQGSADGISWPEALPEEQDASELSSSSRDLRLLFERELSLSGEWLDKRSSSDSLMAEEMQSFFMTQVAEATENLEREAASRQEASAQTESKPQPVPRRYKGYEELLDGPTDPEFIEPRGIHQNVKALEWTLRHPLVYREARATLDSFQKPYVPMERKVLRAPVPPVRKTKAQTLEEVLEQMQTPSNIVELPLVCVLRRKKANWREYREALALLKDFRQRYKATVAPACKARSIHKKQSHAEEQSRTPTLESLAQVRVSGPLLRAPSAKSSKELGKRHPSFTGREGLKRHPL